MLCLSRRKNEKVMVGDGSFVQVLEIQGDKVRLGFEFPKDTPVHREEIYLQIKGKKDDQSQGPSDTTGEDEQS